MKKISWFFCLVLLFGVNISVNAQSSAVWNGTADVSWYTENPGLSEYEISTAEQLAGLAQLVNDRTQSFYGITIRLTQDIVLNDTTNWQNWETTPPANEWTAIGTSTLIGGVFRGTFDGQGNEVAGVYINTLFEDGRGLFGIIVGGIIENVGVVSFRVSVRTNGGGLVGAISDTGIVANSYSRGMVFGLSGVGGLVGSNSGGVVMNSYNSGSVTSDGLAGGVVGGNGTNGIILNSYNAGVVSGNRVAGGVAGQNVNSVIASSYNSGLVTGDRIVGGVVGMNEGGTITNSYFLAGTAASGIGADGMFAAAANNHSLASTAATMGYVTPKTEAQFTSGEVAWLLQGAQEVLAWGHTVLNGGEFPRLAFESPEVRQVSRTAFESQEPDYQFVNIQNEPEFSVKLGPNPIKESLVITISDAGDYVGRVVRLSVYDSRGRAFRREEMVVNGVYDEVEIDVSQLPAGVCFVVLEVEGFDAKRVTFAKVSD